MDGKISYDGSKSFLPRKRSLGYNDKYDGCYVTVLPRKDDMMRFEKEAMNMNGKVEKLKRSLREYKVAAIMDIVVFVGVLIALAFVDVPRYVLVPMLASVLFVNGIAILQLVGKTAEVLKGVVPVEDNEY